MNTKEETVVLLTGALGRLSRAIGVISENPQNPSIAALNSTLSTVKDDLTAIKKAIQDHWPEEGESSQSDPGMPLEQPKM